jgi:hypothetical protein
VVLQRPLLIDRSTILPHAGKTGAGSICRGCRNNSGHPEVGLFPAQSTVENKVAEGGAIKTFAEVIIDGESIGEKDQMVIPDDGVGCYVVAPRLCTQTHTEWSVAR